MGLENILKKSIGASLLAGSLLFSNGCGPDGSYSPIGNVASTISPERSIINMPVTDRRTERKITNGKINLQIGGINQNQNTGEIALNGTGVECTYHEEVYEQWTEKTQEKFVRAGGWVAWGEPKKTFHKERISSKDMSFVPSDIDISVNHNTYKTHVNPDGSFDTKIFAENFKARNGLKYYDVKTEQCDVYVREADSSGKSPAGDIDMLTVGKVNLYNFQINNSKIENYVSESINSKFFTVTINAKDSNTRVPVGVQNIVVKRESDNGINVILEKEFEGDEWLIGIAKTHLRQDLNESGKLNGSGQSISFVAFPGTTYSVETTDPNYHYTKSSFVADKNSPDKSVLLVEVGTKIRIDETKEGKGSLVDNK